MCETAGEGPINMCGFTGKPRPSSGGFLKWGYPSIIHFNWIFHYKPSSYWGNSSSWDDFGLDSSEGHCGTCWAFAATSVVESAVAIANPGCMVRGALTNWYAKWLAIHISGVYLT